MAVPGQELQTGRHPDWGITYEQVPATTEVTWSDTDHRQQCNFVLRSLNASGFKNYQELVQRYPMARIFEIQANPSRFVASVFDRTTQGWKYSQRVLTEQNSGTFERLSHDTPYLYVDTDAQTAQPRDRCDELKGQGISVRVLMVVHNGWLIYFGKRNAKSYLLTEKQFLVFTGSARNVIYRRIFDAKREDMRELFLKINTLRTGDEFDGMTILRAIVQQDTETNGTYVVNGEGNAILPMRQIQRMMTTDTGNEPPPGEESAQPQPSTGGMAPSQGQSSSVARPSTRVEAHTGARSKTK